MKYYPVFLDINDRKCLVVGGGAVGTRKAVSLVESGARVTVVSPKVTERLQEMARQAVITLKKRDYRSTDIDGVFLVIGATDREKLNKQINRDAEKLNTLCNIADKPEVCNFILPATVRRGDLSIAISTSGKSPAFAKKLRKDIQTQFGHEYEIFLQLMGAIRSVLLAEKHAPEEHKPIFNRIIQGDMIELIKAGNVPEIDNRLHDILGEGFNFNDLVGPGHE